MDKIYLILVDNGESYEDHLQSELGYVENEAEAKEICMKLENEARNDVYRLNYLQEQCKDCKSCECKYCDIEKERNAIEEKDMYAGCWHAGDGTYIYRDIEKL